MLLPKSDQLTRNSCSSTTRCACGVCGVECGVWLRVASANPNAQQHTPLNDLVCRLRQRGLALGPQVRRAQQAPSSGSGSTKDGVRAKRLQDSRNHDQRVAVPSTRLPVRSQSLVAQMISLLPNLGFGQLEWSRGLGSLWSDLAGA
jgi:hypothetical protein